jgi:hypothetical protein
MPDEITHIDHVPNGIKGSPQRMLSTKANVDDSSNRDKHETFEIAGLKSNAVLETTINS